MPEIHVPWWKTPRVRVTLVTGAAAAIATIGAYDWTGSGKHPIAVDAPPAIPVQMAYATRRDVPVYLEGLGTVQAFYTVNVTTRVDGQLQTINFVEGQDVKKGSVLAQIDPRLYQAALDQANATKEKDEAQLANAKLDLQRYIELAPQNFTSKQTLDTQRALVQQLEAQVKLDQGVIETAATNLDYTTIRSPIDGTLGILLVNQGNNLLTSANTNVVVVTQMHPISVIFSLPEEDLPAIAKAQASHPLTVVALSRDNKTVLDQGKLLAIDNEIIQTAGTVRLKATFPNAKNTLWPGQFVNIRLQTETRRNVLTLPSTAVQRGPNGLFVYVVKPNATVQTQPVALDDFQDNTAIIESGLQPGEEVVAAGQYRLHAGARIESSSARLASVSPPKPAAPESQP